MHGALLALLTASLLQAQSPDTATAGAAPRTYDGSRGELAVELPRLERAEVRVDGELAEAEWSRAAVLTGFTQRQPAEGAPASERTEVLVFYTSSHLYVGVRAFARDPSRVRASLAERDRVGDDDVVQVLLDTFHDRRRAFALMVNPLGIQQDGVYTEAGGQGEKDLAPDFLFDSRGRVTADGYVVELRIPFKSLKFPGGDAQTWGVNVFRRVAATGAEEWWAPVSRSNPSTLAQSGTLVGVGGLRPGRLFEANPTVTARRVGEREEESFSRDDPEGELGLNLKYGLTSNLTLDATINPDFSQVEADAEQITVNERFDLSLPEKRPFFLEGADLFESPEPLVYTRSILDPAAGVKLTGKAGAFGVAYLGAVDESPLRSPPRFAPEAHRALFSIARLQRDVGAGSNVGFLATSRETGGSFNRVAAVDGKLRFGGLYFWQFQAAGSWTRAWAPDAEGGETVEVGGEPVPVALHDRAGHLTRLVLDRTGRRWGFIVQGRDVARDFRTETGFVRRTGLSELFAANRVSWYGRPGARLEELELHVSTARLWEGRALWEGRGPLEGRYGARLEASLRGNHSIEVGYDNRFFVLDPAEYAEFSLLDDGGNEVTGDVLVAPGRELRGLHGVSVEAGTSHWEWLELELGAGWREVPIFAEGVRGSEWVVEGEVLLRPTEALRVEGTLERSLIYRRRDGSRFSQALIPRLKVEYQLTRALGFRAVGQYGVEEVDLLRAPDGRPYLSEGLPFRLRDGDLLREDDLQVNPLRIDLLAHYQPSPGTVVFLGYGREMGDEGAFRFGRLQPESDGLFLKISYLFRS